jgi:acyl dehydratase
MSDTKAMLAELEKLVGLESPPMTYDVEKGHVTRFAEAIGDMNAAYHDAEKAKRSRAGALIAPPTFGRALFSGALPDAQAKTPYKRVLDGGSEWEYFEPVRVGEKLTVTAKYGGFKLRQGSMGEMLFVTMIQTYKLQNGKVACTQTSTRIYY